MIRKMTGPRVPISTGRNSVPAPTAVPYRPSAQILSCQRQLWRVVMLPVVIEAVFIVVYRVLLMGGYDDFV
jgi:hypothetical protein